MIVAIGSDHRGFDMKADILRLLNELGIQSCDVGAYDTQSVDYPDIAHDVCRQVVQGTCVCGILLCGTGIGMSIAANKVRGIRAALCCNTFMAERARQHNNANVLCMGAENNQDAENIVKVFLTSAFEDERHVKRLDKIVEMEKS
ncbi:MAG: ribose 5-phosphate isomerase B [Dehalococcoidia bacterium]|nr:ribose 5-phosphate isomerase B [Dehalococcoidia bacterium]